MPTTLMKVLLLLFACLLPCLVLAQPYRIMCLGNSITQGDANHPSYRYRLFEKLVDAGIDFEYVGSHTENKWGSDSPKQNVVYKGKTFTNRNEGHWGWRADEIINGQDDYNPPGIGLEVWLQSYTPDIALLHLGTNDIFQGQSTSQTIKEVEQIIQIIRNKNPAVTILLAKLIPANKGQAINDTIQVYNNKIQQLGSALHTANSTVVVVDQNSGFDTSSMLWDEAHPNEQGEERMAQRWYDALMPLFAPLPVKLISFKAELTSNGSVQLNWQTASEQNNAHFEVQRSTDKVNFIPVGKVKGAGTTQATNSYSYLDTAAPATNLYYRLKQVDYNGKSELSKIVSVQRAPALSKLYVYPTTTHHQNITVLLQHFEPNAPFQLTIYAANGTVVSKKTKATDLAGNYTEIVNLNRLLGQGLYFVKVIAGDKQMQSRFLVSP